MARAAACAPTQLAQAGPPSEPPLPRAPRPLGPLPRAQASLAGGGAGGGTLRRNAARHWAAGARAAARRPTPRLWARLRREGPRLKPGADQSGGTRAAAAET